MTVKLYEKYMFVIGIGGSLIYFLQAIKIFNEHNTAAVSLLAFTIGFISVFSWLIYGILIRNKVLIVSNILATIGALWVLLGFILYRT